MANNENMGLRVEINRTKVAIALLTQSASSTEYTTGIKYWSDEGAFKPVVRPNGVLSGFSMTPSGTADTVNIAAGEANLNGVQLTKVSGTLLITRPTVSNFKISSVTLDAAGAFVEVQGAEDTAFSIVRAALGGPPLIPVDSVELGQVLMDAQGAAVFVAAELKQIINDSQEVATFPNFTIDFENGRILVPLGFKQIHTGVIARAVWAEYHTAGFLDMERVSSVQLPNTSRSVSSDATNTGPVGNVTSSVNAGSATIIGTNGVIEPAVLINDQKVWVIFNPDKNQSPHSDVQCFWNAVPSFDAAANLSIAVTMTAENAASNLGA